MELLNTMVYINDYNKSCTNEVCTLHTSYQPDFPIVSLGFTICKVKLTVSTIC
jgi:hypothetical protein